MALFSPETIERVKQAADLVEIISAHTDLRRQGVRYTGLCPFHDEKTPSFSVNPQEGFYYCFGCEATGDAIKFVQEKEGLDFPTALETVADRYGVEVTREEEDPRAEQRRQRLKRLQELLERSAAFYAAYLWGGSRESAKTREYLDGRGLGEQVIRDFGIGLAPSVWDQLLVKGQEAGFSIEEMLSAGLVQRGRQGGAYDRFRARLMFPVRDARGRMLGFGARALRDNQGAKYLNSAESELFHKSRILFGLDRANASIRRADNALVVEGYTDVLALHQAGFEHAVAVMGTAVTPDHLATLSGMAATVTLAMDADRSGQEAMLKAQKAARERQMEIRVLRLPPGQDPSEMLQKEAPERFSELANTTVGFEEFQVLTALDRSDLSSARGRDQALGEIAPTLAQMGESIQRDELLRLVADRLNVGPELVGQMLQRAVGAKRTASAEPGAEGSPPPKPRMLTPQERRERALLAMCIASPDPGRAYLERLGEEHLSSPLALRAREWLLQHLESPLTGLPRDDEELMSLVTQLVLEAEREPAPEHAMKLNFLLLEQQRIERGISEASERGDDSARTELTRKRADLVQSLRSVEMGES